VGRVDDEHLFYLASRRVPAAIAKRLITMGFAQEVLERPSVAVDHNNPLCGDRIHLELLIEDGRIAEIGHTGEGCSISQSSTSMMNEVLAGRPLDEALGLIEHFRLVMHGEKPADEDRLRDAIALDGVAKYPVRVKCALLSWMAAKDAILSHDAHE